MKVDLLKSETNEIITLIADKTEQYCYMLGANDDANWRESNNKRHVWIFDRIDRLIYNKTFSSESAFDHSISVRWKKPIGRGEKDPGILKGIIKEYDGKYYYSCAFGFHVLMEKRWHHRMKDLLSQYWKSWMISNSVILSFVSC